MVHTIEIPFKTVLAAGAYTNTIKSNGARKLQIFGSALTIQKLTVCFSTHASHGFIPSPNHDAMLLSRTIGSATKNYFHIEITDPPPCIRLLNNSSTNENELICNIIKHI